MMSISSFAFNPAAALMVGWDLDFQPGTCGKYDHAPVSDGQPTIRIPEITIGGRG